MLLAVSIVRRPVEFCCAAQLRQILAAHSQQAEVDEKRQPPHPFCGGADEAQIRTTPPVRAGL